MREELYFVERGVMDTVYMVQAGTGQGDTTVVVLSLVVALAAVIVGPVIQNLIARKQTLLPMRLQWIEKLRSEIADYLTTLHMVYVKTQVDEKKAREDLFGAIETLVAIRYRIELMLNPNETSHVELISKLDGVIEQLPSEEKATDANFLSVLKEVLSAAKPVLKAEWNRIKTWSP